MRVLRRVVLTVAAIVIVLIAIGYLLPQRVAIARSIDIDAPPAVVFPLVGDLRQVHKWSPWLGIDPEIRIAFSGPDVGVGQTMTWASDNPQVGRGTQTVIEYEPGSRAVTSLDFGPQGRATATTTVEPRGAGSRVTWSFETDLGMNPVARYFGLALEGMIAPDFERGLAALKRVAEAEATSAPESTPGSGTPPGAAGSGGAGSTVPATPQAGGADIDSPASGTGTSGTSTSASPPASPAPARPSSTTEPSTGTAPTTAAPSTTSPPSSTPEPSTTTPGPIPQTVTPTPPPTPPPPQPVAPILPQSPGAGTPGSPAPGQ